MFARLGKLLRVDLTTHRATEESIAPDLLLRFTDGEELGIATKTEVTRVLLVSGKPIGEPVAWYGPIVMNTEEELQVAFQEYQGGTFTKHH